MEPVRADDVSRERTEHGETAFRRKRLAAAAASEREVDLGCSLYELPPGVHSWSYHYHAGNAEAFYVLAGAGMLRAADDEHRLHSGDTCPVRPAQRAPTASSTTATTRCAISRCRR